MMRAYNAITAFANAQVKGSEKILRAFKDHPKRTSLRAIGGITVPSVILWYVNKDDENYQELPNWRKVLFWNFIFHEKDGSLKRVLSLPKPFELGIVFGSLPEMSLNYVYKKDKTGLEEGFKTMFQAFFPGVLPTAVISPIENYANKSIFFDRPIVPRGKEDLLPEFQFGPRTTETVKILGKVVSKIPGVSKFASPGKLENVIRSWTGNLGYLSLQASDKILKTLGVTNPPTRPSMTLSDIPGIRGFAVRFPSSSSKSIEDFYRLYIEEQTKWKSQGAGQGQIGGLVRKVLTSEEVLRKSDKLKFYGETAKTLSNIRTVVGIISESNMDSDKKKKTLDILYYRMINTARRALGKKPMITKKQF